MSMSNSPVVSVMAPVTERLMVSPGEAARMAVRRDPAPLSAVEVTVAAGKLLVVIKTAANNGIRAIGCFMFNVVRS